MQTNINGVRYKKIYFRKRSTDDFVLYKKGYVDGVLTYSAGNPVTYYVDSDTVYTEEVDYDASCLLPKTFTPYKDGWTFVGWREDTVASADVLSSKVMEDDPVTLYAVFSKVVTLTTVANNAATDYNQARYFNAAGNYANPSFTVSNPTMTGATFNGWSVTSGSIAVTYASINNMTLSENAVLYAVFKIADSIKYLSFDIQEYSKVISTTGTYHSIYTGVDKSLYSGAKLALSYMNAETHYAYSRLYLRFTDRSVSAQIANVYNDGEASSIVSSNLNPAITFANATGTANLSLLAISAGTGAGYEGSTQADYVLQGGTLTVIGRTIVSRAVEEEPEPEPEAVLLTSDGYTLKDVNGVYLTTKEDE